MNCSLLLVDDDLDDRDIFLDAVRTVGEIEFLWKSNGREALEYLKSTPNLPDFIFLDLNMPIMSGWDCIKEIKKVKKLSKIPVIIYSTAYHEEDKDQMKRLGGNYLFRKPVDFDQLCDTIRSIVEGAPVSNNDKYLYHC